MNDCCLYLLSFMRQIFGTGFAILTVSSAILAITPNRTQALSFGEALGIGAGALLIQQTVQNNRTRYRFVPPEQEFQRGLEDGFNLVRYDNPRDSGDYNRGFVEGRRRRADGWISPNTRR
jgi:hypothetical protein